MAAEILLVDDDPDLLKLIGLRLSAAGYRVKNAESGEIALAQIAVSHHSRCGRGDAAWGVRLFDQAF